MAARQMFGRTETSLSNDPFLDNDVFEPVDFDVQFNPVLV